MTASGNGSGSARAASSGLESDQEGAATSRHAEKTDCSMPARDFIPSESTNRLSAEQRAMANSNGRINRGMGAVESSTT